MIKYLVIAIFTFMLLGCTHSPIKPRLGSPFMQKMLTQGPEGPTLYKQGWRDGCETGMSSVANMLQRSFYTFKQNADLAQNKVYYTGWKTAYTYCQRYLFQYLRRLYI